MTLEGRNIGIMFYRLEDDCLRLVVSTPEEGQIIDFTQTYSDALENLRAAARVLGFVLVPHAEML